MKEEIKAALEESGKYEEIVLKARLALIDKGWGD